MTIRSDIIVDFSKSPRIGRIAAPSVELTQQDAVDTLRTIEAQLVNSAFERLTDAAGKEDLGGGVSVGITTTLQDLVFAFDARKASISSGTVTTPDTSGLLLRDSTATFISDNVQPGAQIVNFADLSVCSCVTVDSETQITTDALGDGTDNRWDSGDAYKIWPVIQVEASGGNMTAVDSLGATISSVLPTWGTQVKVTAASSATATESQDIQQAAFDGGVTIDVVNGTSGVIYPQGTRRAPVDNLTDAKFIASLRGFNQLFVLGNITFGPSDVLDGFDVVGESILRTLITLDPPAGVTNNRFLRSSVTGTLDGANLIIDASTNDVTIVDGNIARSIITGDIILSTTSQVLVLACWAGVTPPNIDGGGSNGGIHIRSWSGDISLSNKSGSEFWEVDMQSGQVTIQPSVTNGIIDLQGVGEAIDNSGPGATINDRLVNTGAIASAVWADTDGADVVARLFDVFQNFGLDLSNPLVITSASRGAGGVSLTITEAPVGTQTIQRI